MKHRIWELDAFRGICIIGVVLVHLCFDLIDLYGIVSWDYPDIILFLMNWGGILFILLSGICATLGRKSVRRGLVVFSCGLLITAVTYAMYHFDFADKSIIIYFGVLHCLGVCMMLWWLLKWLPSWLLLILAVPMIVIGLYWDTIAPMDHLWLMPFGLVTSNFCSADYFPLLPNLGYFLVGAVIGRTAYRKKETLLPRVNPKNPVIRFFSFCGKHSLPIYLLHQPIIAGICMLLL